MFKWKNVKRGMRVPYNSIKEFRRAHNVTSQLEDDMWFFDNLEKRGAVVTAYSKREDTLTAVLIYDFVKDEYYSVFFENYESNRN